MLRKKLPTPIRKIGKMESPYGVVTVDEWQDYFRFRFDDDSCFFIKAEGDLARISFNIGTMCLEKNLNHVLWLLNSTKVAELVNPKFGNKPEMHFSAAIYATTDKDKRSCVILPTDTTKTAMQRFKNVWFKQAPISGYCGKLATHVE